MNNGDGASHELVAMFCYLGDMLSVDADADAAVETRVCKRLNKFRQLALYLPIMTSHFLSEGNYTEVECVVVRTWQ